MFSICIDPFLYFPFFYSIYYSREKDLFVYTFHANILADSPFAWRHVRAWPLHAKDERRSSE